MVQGKRVVSSSLIVDTKDFTKPFTVGIHFKLEPEWHIYWKNPGDAGTPVEVNWSLPKGFSASSELEHPVPYKFVVSDIVGYGYNKEVVLTSQITPPQNIDRTKPLTVTAKLSWLACKESCVPGDTTISIDLGKLTDQNIASGKALIDAYRAKLPPPYTQLDLKLEESSLISQSDKKMIRLVFSGNDSKRITDFFPGALNDAFITYNDIKVQDAKITFPIQLSDTNAALPALKGILMLGDKGYDFSATLSKGSSDLANQEFAIQGTKTSDVSIWFALALALFGGVLLNIMPCVLPVLSLKVLGFVQHSGDDKSKTRTLSLIFALGVLASFWVLAAGVGILQHAGSQIGWGFQFQSPWFVIGMSVVVFVFGLNLVGVFEFSSPAVSGELGKSLSRHDAFGSFMNGVLATTLATPCTAPFLGTALGFAFSQPFIIILAIFTMVGLGLAAPYVILSWNPNWLKFIPKPGEWMNRFKQAMGFLLFATLVWLLSVLGSQVGSQGVVATLGLLLGISVAAWLVGSLINYSTSSTKKGVVWSIALLITGLSYYLSLEKWFPLRELDKPQDVLANIDKSTIQWVPFSLDTVEKEVLSGKPVFIDFTANWCFTCKVTEQTVLETEDVEKKIIELGIVPVRADWTNRNDEITRLMKKFGRSGVPLYVVFPAGDISEPIVLPEVITKDMLLAAFEKAAKKPVKEKL
ncbi:MAG: thiol:disulfide interchange protein [Chlorobiales bacterium]|nr:thiol:disulfide interchange protein [Chlorobiales bacterium]